jgi:hypothetical protein
VAGGTAITHDWLPGVRADDLRADDRILMFGHAIRIVASWPIDELPGVQAVTFRTNRGDRDIATTLPADWRMLGAARAADRAVAVLAVR